jgi:hypothetical protein
MPNCRDDPTIFSWNLVSEQQNKECSGKENTLLSIAPTPARRSMAQHTACLPTPPCLAPAASLAACLLRVRR